MKKTFITMLAASFAAVGVAQKVQDPIIWETNKDAYVSTRFHSFPLGFKDKLTVMTWTYNGALLGTRALVDFPFQDFPANVTLDSAVLKLYFIDTYVDESFKQHSGSNEMFLDRIIGQWGDSVYWDNQPQVTETNRVTIPKFTDPKQDYSINVTEQVKDILLNPGVGTGFMLRNADEINPYIGTLLCSKEHANASKHPKLLLYVTPKPSPSPCTVYDTVKVTVNDTVKLIVFDTVKVYKTEVIAVQSIVPSNIPIDGLIGWWPFNGDAADKSGNSNDGTISGATLTADRFNKDNSAYSFENGGKSIDVGSNDILKVESFSIGAWVNLNRFPTTQETAGGILSEGGKGDGNGTDANFTLSIHNYSPWGAGPAVYFGFETETGDNILISHKLENSFLKTWNHLLGTYDSKNGNLYLYINGVLTDSLKGVTKLPYKSDYPALIGGGIVNASDQVEFFLDATIDDVALWGRALTPHEAVSVWGNVLVKVYDTVKVQEIVKVEINDTIKVFDTVKVQEIVKVEINDTIKVYDIVKVTVTDTLRMKFVATKTPETVSNESLVKIYPNPAKTDIQLSFSSELVSAGNAIEITTMTGVTVFSSDITASLLQCNVSEIGGVGSYVVSVKDSSGKVLSSSNLQIVE